MNCFIYFVIKFVIFTGFLFCGRNMKIASPQLKKFTTTHINSGIVVIDRKLSWG